MVTLTTTFDRLRQHGARPELMGRLGRRLGTPEASPGEPISLVAILLLSGLPDAVWALRTMREPRARDVARLFVTAFADQVEAVPFDQAVAVSQAAALAAAKAAWRQAYDQAWKSGRGESARVEAKKAARAGRNAELKRQADLLLKCLTVFRKNGGRMAA